MTINRTVRKVTGSASGQEDKLITKDNGIVHYQWTPEQDDEFIHITVSLTDGPNGTLFFLCGDLVLDVNCASFP